VARLFADYRGEELASFKRTGVYPIMHVIAVRKSLLAAYPWAARNLFLAFEESKRRSLERLTDISVSRYPVPWMPDTVEQIAAEFGGDPFPYGVAANIKTLETFLTWTFEQGIARRLAKPAEIFAPGLDVSVKV
jgi:4,5-dihydroxyphthalate decarboxylase